MSVIYSIEDNIYPKSKNIIRELISGHVYLDDKGDEYIFVGKGKYRRFKTEKDPINKNNWIYVSVNKVIDYISKADSILDLLEIITKDNHHKLYTYISYRENPIKMIVDKGLLYNETESTLSPCRCFNYISEVSGFRMKNWIHMSDEYRVVQNDYPTLLYTYNKEIDNLDDNIPYEESDNYININENVYVKLTEYGKTIISNVSIDKNGFSKYKLNEFMTIFGKYLNSNNNQIIMDGKIYLEKK